MLNDREILILKYLAKKQGEYVTTKELAEELDVSVRTIKTNIKNLQEYFSTDSDVQVTSVRSKGITLECRDVQVVMDKIAEIQSQTIFQHNSPTNRINRIMLDIMNQSLSKVDLMHSYHVSEPTVNGDLDKVREILKSYKLSLEVENKIQVIGDETDKRKLLGQYKNFSTNLNSGYLFSIENIVLKILIDEKYNVTDKVFNNILVHIQISIDRMKSGNIIESFSNLASKWQSELNIANKILAELGKVYNFEVYEGEVVNLAIILIGKSDLDNQSYIPETVSNFIEETLKEIDEKFHVTFSDNIENRLNLSLHLVPLLERIKHGINLDNEIVEYINHSFPLAIDISAFFSMKIYENYGYTVPKNEIAYLAIHFNNFLIEFDASLGKKKVLIISNIRRSESILLRQRLLTWFREEVSNVEVVNYNDVENLDIDKVDIIFSTDDDKFVSRYSPILISKFPRDDEYLNIKLAIDGFRSKDDIISLFKEELFMIYDAKSKDEVFYQFSMMLESSLNGLSPKFMESVIARETMSNTYFRNKIAFPHPAIPLSLQSFVATIVLEDPIIWNEDRDKVQIVMLVAIEKNNTKSFQLWNYLSGLTKDEMFSQRIRKVSNYEDFIKLLDLSIEYNK